MSKITDEVLAVAAELKREPLSEDRWTLGGEVLDPLRRYLVLCAHFPDHAQARQILLGVAASAIATLEATAAKGTKENA